MRRVIRIFPVYYVVIIFFFWILYPVLNGYEFYQPLHKTQVWFWLYLENWLDMFRQGFLKSPVVHFWSLAVEEQFYLLWPVIIYFCPRRLLNWLCGIIILSAAILRIWLLLTNPSLEPQFLGSTIYYNTLFRIDTLTIGALIASWVRSEYILPRLLWVLKPVLITSGVSLGIIFVTQGDLDRTTQVVQIIGYPLLAIFFGALLILAIAQPKDSLLVKILTWSPLSRLGKVSYGFYIYHLLLLYVLTHTVQLPSWGSYILDHLSIALAVGILTIGVSLLSWFYLEQPLLHFKAYFPEGKMF